MQQEIKIPINLGTKEEQIGDSNSSNIKISSLQSKSFFKSTKEKWIFFAFITPPFVISTISMFHLVSFFIQVDNYAMALFLAIAIELSSIMALVGLAVLNKLNKSTLWSLFLILCIIQILGNMWHSFTIISDDSLLKILELLSLQKDGWSIRLVSFLTGGILPCISLIFTKLAVEYFRE